MIETPPAAATVIFLLLCSVAIGQPATPSQLPYAVLPQPQKIELTGSDFPVSGNWKLMIDSPAANDLAGVQSLKEQLPNGHDLQLNDADPSGSIHFSVQPNSVAVGDTLDNDKQIVAAQAYRLTLAPRHIEIQANSADGLFYGVQTLLQLVRHHGTGRLLPRGQITDWPDTQLRILYWDDAHHLERMDALKQAIRQASYFKFNAFAIKLEGHFEFHSAPALVEPQALSPAQLQELTDYALRWHVQLIPYLDAPAHIAFILKHREYARLRAFPDSNYEMCTLNPDSYKLLEGMYQDLLDANQGARYFFLSTDEPYYIGQSNDPSCPEAAREKELGSPGRLLAQFLKQAAGYLHDRGRTVLFWGEFPMKAADVPALPDDLINGETNDPAFDAAFKARGMRQLFYTSAEGEEKLFPNYFLLAQSRRLHDPGDARPRVPDAVHFIRTSPARKDANIMGLFVAGWADMGLHPETFWLGYCAIGAAGWNPRTDPQQATTDFFQIFYGPSASSMQRIYELLSYQTQFWSDSWETAASTHRKGIWGNSNSIYHPRHPASDQVLPLPPVPSSKDLSVQGDWSHDNTRRLQLANTSLRENDELLKLLDANIAQAQFNKYNLQVLRSVALLCRQNLQMIVQIGQINDRLLAARDLAAGGRAADALAELDNVPIVAESIRRQRNKVLKETTDLWYQTWLPRVAQANGRTFLHELDDVKDHLPDRTIGMEYLVYRELILPLGQWVREIHAARNAYAASHKLPETSLQLDWEDLK